LPVAEASKASEIAAPRRELVARFATILDQLVPKEERIGLAVSGGPDSLALLLLATAARPGQVKAATVDHALRPEAAAEAEMVGAICADIGVPHSTLVAEWEETPVTAIQARARAERYRLLIKWATERQLSALVTAHHLDDQAETLMMRLNRGSGVQGLASMRARRPLAGGKLKLVRPLLSWTHEELETVCADARIEPVRDPSNEDEGFERVRMRKSLAGSEWVDSKALAKSAAHLAAADAALKWAANVEWNRGVTTDGSALLYKPAAPPEIRRRIAARAVRILANEGKGQPLRGRELDQLMAVLRSGRKATLRGVLCSGGDQWRFTRAPKRRTS
jgi:tRNA(Ile)-lysidine synthase